MFITADQLVAHAIGDYILQSDWMAQNKTKAHVPALCHALVYSAGFALFRPSIAAWLVIFGTHFFIDRYRLASYVVWAKNFLGPTNFYPPRWNGQEQKAYPRRNWPWESCKNTGGYPPNAPMFMWIWLMIIADNIIHVLINGASLKFL